MKKEMKSLLFVVIILGVFLFSNPVIADFNLGGGNSSYEINSIYGPGEALRGWINISFADEPADSLFTAFDSNISVLDFLNENNINCEFSSSCSCFPTNCKPAYSSDGSGINSKTLSLNYAEEIVLGVRLVGEIQGITSFSFDVETNAGTSCPLHPIKIDLLDDGFIEWKSDEVSETLTCGSSTFGCFNNADSGDSAEITADSIYCQTITFPNMKGFKIGAVVSGTGDADFKMSIDDYEKTCNANANGDGEIGCVIEFDDDLEYFTDLVVCIEEGDLKGNTYEIKYETTDVCGYSGEEGFDFEIFIKPMKYSSVEDFTFNQQLMDDRDNGIDLISEIEAYVSEIYDYDCSPECIIPIRIYSGISQETIISSLSLGYDVLGQPDTAYEEDIYYVINSGVEISSEFLKLDLEKGDFLVPKDIGDETVVLELDNDEVFSEKIDILAVPIIKNIVVSNPSALVPITFLVLLEDSGVNLTYTWDFGDGGSKQTSETNTIKHTYSNIGVYDVTATISNKYGNSSKTINLKVVSPREAINSTIIKYKENLVKVESQISALVSWVKTEIEKKVDLDSLSAGLKLQEDKYLGIPTDEESVKIMTALLELNIPSSLNISQKINPLVFYPNEKEFDLDVLEDLGAGRADGSREAYVNAVNNWLSESLGITIESKTYAIYFDDGLQEDLVSYVKVFFQPKQDLDEFYFVINEDSSNIDFNGEVNTKDSGSSTAIIFDELGGSESKTIEFLYPGKISVGILPFYISPKFRNLELVPVVGVCNNNQKCEKTLGETNKNCRADCKPLGRTIAFLVILVLVSFIIYIILQEWYKRHYQKKLFPNSNQLFNLINFMANSINQGLRKSVIFSKLKKVGWVNEKLGFAWKKLHGKKTGMWEIPVFKGIEKQRIKKELKKRGNTLNLKGLSLR